MRPRLLMLEMYAVEARVDGLDGRDTLTAAFMHPRVFERLRAGSLPPLTTVAWYRAKDYDQSTGTWHNATPEERAAFLSEKP